MNDAEGGEERMGRWQKAEKVAIRVTPMGNVKKGKRNIIGCIL